MPNTCKTGVENSQRRGISLCKYRLERDPAAIALQFSFMMRNGSAHAAHPWLWQRADTKRQVLRLRSPFYSQIFLLFLGLV